MTVSEFTTEELRNEEWRDVVGYEGIYSVSNLGRLRRDAGGVGAKAGRILRTSPDSRGYLSTMLYLKGKGKSRAVHKLVAMAFLGECPEGFQVNHKEQPKTNNRVSNLEYLTQMENMQHAKENGLLKPARGDRHGSYTKPERVARGDRHGFRVHPDKAPRGDTHGMKKLDDAEIPRIFELRKSGLSQAQIGAMVGICQAHISKILSGKCRKSPAVK